MRTSPCCHTLATHDKRNWRRLPMPTPSAPPLPPSFFCFGSALVWTGIDPPPSLPLPHHHHRSVQEFKSQLLVTCGSRVEMYEWKSPAGGTAAAAAAAGSGSGSGGGSLDKRAFFDLPSLATGLVTVKVGVGFWVWGIGLGFSLDQGFELRLGLRLRPASGGTRPLLHARGLGVVMQHCSSNQCCTSVADLMRPSLPGRHILHRPPRRTTCWPRTYTRACSSCDTR